MDGWYSTQESTRRLAMIYNSFTIDFNVRPHNPSQCAESAKSALPMAYDNLHSMKIMTNHEFVRPSIETHQNIYVARNTYCIEFHVYFYIKLNFVKLALIQVAVIKFSSNYITCA